MIELTEQQMQALENPDLTPPRVVNPQTKETFVLLRLDEYERLKEHEYDDSPWTREETDALAWEAGKSLGWEEMDEYDAYPPKAMTLNRSENGAQDRTRRPLGRSMLGFSEWPLFAPLRHTPHVCCPSFP